ncbi:MAG: zinc-dependent metalloprotease [Brooklawnia sp.]|jgi:coenzyme F420 biosynthesis associated uncharacterized protein
MSVLPWIDWDEAERVAIRMLSPGPKASRQQRDQLVRQLRSQTIRATGIITRASGLPVAGDVGELVVDRRNIVRANVNAFRHIFNQLGAEPDGPLSAAGGYLRGSAIGPALALIGSRVLGQYDAFGPSPALYLVAPSIMAVERQLKVNPTDFRMWVVLHEQTHRVQFANAPWLRDHLIGQMHELVADTDEPFWRDIGERLEQIRRDRADGRPTSLRVVNALSSPTTVAAMDQVSAAMSLLEGHADVMMDRAGREVIPTVTTIRARFEARRARRGIFALINKLLGMDAKLAQYADGARFCRHVIGVGGTELLNRAFEGPQNLPNLAELLHPQQWCDRMLADGQA